MSLVGLLALLAREPMLFPSLGATAYLLFAHPEEHQARFRNAFVSHLAGAFIGWGALELFVAGFGNHVPAALDVLQAQTWMAHQWLYIAASAVSVGLTLAFMVATRTEHSPACSTTLLFSLGVFQHLWQIAVLMVGVALLLACGTGFRRILAARNAPPSEPPGSSLPIRADSGSRQPSPCSHGRGKAGTRVNRS
jgi:CBS-domain-containing membrane protein